MPSFADYTIIRDTQKLLEVGADIDWQTSINVPTTTNLELPFILQWYYVGATGAALSYRFTINGDSVRTHHIIGNVYGTAHEVISPSENHFKHLPQTNTFVMKIVSLNESKGKVWIGDVVLWYQHIIHGDPFA